MVYSSTTIHPLSPKKYTLMNQAQISPQILVIFGASGDLTRRKLVPAIFQLFCYKYLPKPFIILGVGRSPIAREEFRERLVTGNSFLLDRAEESEKEKIADFATYFHYIDLGGSYDNSFGGIRDFIHDKGTEFGIPANVIYYLSTPPKLYTVIADKLAEVGLNRELNGWKRLIIEKPFGYNYQSAKMLNEALQKDFRENQIFRIDHYLGKETVQNLLVTRFANSIFEPLWNRNYIHHIEITNAESVGVEGRGGYYDQSGALRDMFQNHLMQILSLVAMEPPISNAPEDIRNEKVKALSALRVFRSEEELYSHTIRGQ
jgi:glucose-6-phosphate 1-dehydrogenase